VGIQLGEVKDFSKSINHIPGYFAGYKEGPFLPSTLPIGEMAFHSSQVYRAAKQPAVVWLRLLGHLVFLENSSAVWKSLNPQVQTQLRPHWRQSTDYPMQLVTLYEGTIESLAW